MNTLDIILLVCFIPALIQGLRKGLITQAVNIAAIIIGAFLAFKFSTSLADWLSPTFPETNKVLLKTICFIVIMLVSITVLALVGGLITRLLKFATLGWINRLLGAIFSIFTTALVLGLLIFAFNAINSSANFVEPEKLSNSVVWTSIQNFSEKIFPFIKEAIKAHA